MATFDSTEIDLIARDIQHSDRLKRLTALKQLHAIVQSEMRQRPLNAILDAIYLHLLKCYYDQFESCRSLAIAIVGEFVHKLDARQPFVCEYIVPAIRKRVGLAEMHESSEEVQLQLLGQVAAICARQAATDGDGATRDGGESMVARAHADIADIVVRNLANRFADAQRQCCDIVLRLAVSGNRFAPHAERLVDPLIRMLRHRQSSSRIAAIETLGVVCLHITNKNDKIVASITAISVLLMDSVPNVRRMCGIVGCKWLMSLPDRYSWFERILPLVLCCLHDEIVEVQVEVQKLFIECGNKYYAENEMELQKIELLECEHHPRKPVITTAIAAASEATTTTTTTSAATATAATTLPQPAAAATPPQRPSLGCRAIVQRSLRMIDIVARELSDWQEAVRLHSLRLLWQIVRHAEKAFTSKLAAVLPALCKCAQDDEASVVREAERVATVMGELLDVDDWLPAALEAVQKSPNHVGTMRCFGHLFGGAGGDAKRPHIARIAAAMDAVELGYSVKSAYQAALLDVIVQLVDIHSGRSDPSADEVRAAEEHLFGVAAKTAASSYAHNVHGISERATGIYAQFCGAPANRRALQAKYGPHVIAADQDLEPEYADDSEYVARVCGYVLLFGFQPEIRATLGNSIQAVLQKGSADAKVKMLAAMATAILKWDDTDADKHDIVDYIIGDILRPQLVWRAGREAESVRAMATQALCAVGDSCAAQVAAMFPQMVAQLLALIDDNIAITRAYAIRCVMQSGPFKYDDYRSAMTAMLNRFDDASNDVGRLAIQCVAKIELDSSDAECTKMSSSLIETIIARLILYLDDPSLQLQPIIIDSLTQMAMKHSAIYKAKIDKLPANFPHIDAINAVSAAIER